MKAIIFDSGTLISFTMSGLVPELRELRKVFNGKFLITKEVKKQQWTPINKKMITHKMKAMMSLINQKGQNPLHIKKELQQMMWEYAGVIRSEEGLKKALEELKNYKSASLETGKSLRMNEKLIAALDIKNMLPTCEMILKSALARKESRGAHYRSDYPDTKKEGKKNIMCVPSKKGIKITTRSIKKIPTQIHSLMRSQKPTSHLLE